MYGLIAFFDILGYQSFLENNSAEDNAKHVLDLINQLPNSVKKEFPQHWKPQFEPMIGKKFQSLVDAQQHVIFSDTIVLALPYLEQEKKWRDAAIAYITIFATHLSSRLFARGLPTRGVIHEGNFLIQGTCLAGRCIVEAYRLCSLLDFAGLVYTPELSSKIFDPKDKNPPFVPASIGTFFVDYLSPLNNNTETRLWQLNWPHYFDPEDKKNCDADTNKYVLRSFWAHSKDCPSEVDRKVRATSKLIRRLRIAQELYAERKAPAKRR